MTEPAEPPGVLFYLPVELIGAAAIVQKLEPHLTNLDVPVSGTVTPEQVATLSRSKRPDGKVS